MTALAIIIPTLGRRSLMDTIESLIPQAREGDRITVVCDDHSRYDFCCECVAFARERSFPEVAWRSWENYGTPGVYGHGGRNYALDHLSHFESPPEWCWTLDDDDIAVAHSVGAIREACASGAAPWYVFAMRGGAGSHFPGLVVPTMGPQILEGNVGTPMLVFPTRCQSRFGVDGNERGMGPGYYGDLFMAASLQAELGEPGWRDEVVCEVRPAAVAA